VDTPLAAKKYLIDLLIQMIKAALMAGMAAANQLIYQDKVKFVNGPLFSLPSNHTSF